MIPVVVFETVDLIFEEDEKAKFDEHFLVTVSSTPDVLGILKNLWRKLHGDRELPFMDAEGGNYHIAKSLESTKTLLVLDDVWEAQHLKLLNVATKLNARNGGSRLIVTTRLNEVLADAGGSGLKRKELYQVRPLGH